MKGDKLLFQNHHKLKANKIVSELIRLYFAINDSLVVSIGGESGTGKTEIAYYIRDLLYENKIKTQIISLDDYYKVKCELRNKQREETDAKYVGSNEIDWEILDETIETFKQDKEENVFRQLNKYTGDYEYIYFNDSAVNVLIIEGLYAIDVKESDLRIYLEGNIQDTRGFRMERGKEILNDLRTKVLERESIDIKKTLHRADLIVTFEGELCKKGSW